MCSLFSSHSLSLARRGLSVFLRFTLLESSLRIFFNAWQSGLSLTRVSCAFCVNLNGYIGLERLLDDGLAVV